MKFNVIKPFVMELITFLFVIFFISFALICVDFIKITFHVHFITIMVTVIMLLLLFMLFSRIVNFGVKALIDFVFQKTKEDVYIFLDEQPYKASVFTKKFDHNHKQTIGMYYLIQLKKGQEIHTLLSSSYVEFVKGNAYTIKSGYTSNIFIGIVSKQTHDQSGDGSMID